MLRRSLPRVSLGGPSRRPVASCVRRAPPGASSRLHLALTCRQMRRPLLISMLAASLPVGLLASANIAPAEAALSFVPCQNAPGFTCATIPAPLDRSGKAPGTISLTLERKAAGAAQSDSAVLGLAGGPGQASAPIAEQLATAIAPALRARDLLVLDQ